MHATGVMVEALLKLMGIAECRFCTFYNLASVVGFPCSPGFVEH